MEMSPKLSALRLKLKTTQFELSRLILFLWIKPIFLGGSHESLDLDDSDLICYVLPFRSIADLLVTDKACEASGLPSAVSTILCMIAIYAPRHWRSEDGRAISSVGRAADS